MLFKWLSFWFEYLMCKVQVYQYPFTYIMVNHLLSACVPDCDVTYCLFSIQMPSETLCKNVISSQSIYYLGLYHHSEITNHLISLHILTRVEWYSVGICTREKVIICHLLNYTNIAGCSVISIIIYLCWPFLPPCWNTLECQACWSVLSYNCCSRQENC